MTKKTVFRCKECLWEGTVEEMDYDLMDYMCPNCCSSFTTDGIIVGPWEVAEDTDNEDSYY